MFPFPIRFCPESVRRRVLDLFPQGYVCCSGCAKTITSAWHNCFLSRKRLLHKLGTTVSCRGNGRYIGMAQQLHRYVTGHRLPVVCFEIGIELAWITDATLFQYIQNAFLLVRCVLPVAFAHSIVCSAPEMGQEPAGSFLHLPVGHLLQHPDETECISLLVGRAEIGAVAGLVLLIFGTDDPP